MNFTHSAFVRRAAVVILAGLGVALPQSVIAQANKLVGTWNLVPEKSTVSSGPARYKSATLTVTDTGQMNVEGVDAQGKPVKNGFTAVIDGKPHPITGIATFDNGSWTRNSDSNTSYTYMKGKTIVALGTRVVSADGKTLTFREQVYDRSGKVASAQVMVFDNPNVQVASVVAGPGGVIYQSVMTPEETAAAATLAKGDDDAAIAMFTKIIEGKPTPMFYYDHLSRGIAYAKKSQFEQALADFDRAVALKPDNVDARFRRGTTRNQLKQYPGAIEDLTAVIQADPMNAMAYRMRGFSYNMLEKYNDGGTDTDKACELNKELCL